MVVIAVIKIILNACGVQSSGNLLICQNVHSKVQLTIVDKKCQ